MKFPTCGFCLRNKPSVVMILEQFKSRCPDNGANTRITVACADCYKKYAHKTLPKTYKSIKEFGIVGKNGEGLEFLRDIK